MVNEHSVSPYGIIYFVFMVYISKVHFLAWGLFFYRQYFRKHSAMVAKPVITSWCPAASETDRVCKVQCDYSGVNRCCCCLKQIRLHWTANAKKGKSRRKNSYIVWISAMFMLSELWVAGSIIVLRTPAPIRSVPSRPFSSPLHEVFRWLSPVVLSVNRQIRKDKLSFHLNIYNTFIHIS